MTIRVANIYFALRESLTPEDTVRWIRSPQPVLDNRIPIDLMETDEGCEEVYEAIQRWRDRNFV